MDMNTIRNFAYRIHIWPVLIPLGDILATNYPDFAGFLVTTYNDSRNPGAPFIPGFGLHRCNVSAGFDIDLQSHQLSALLGAL
jgi:hypothetical protein